MDSNVNSERLKGFGSSDAKDIYQFAITGELSNRLKRRIAEMKGQVERLSFSSMYTETGNTIEDDIFNKVKQIYGETSVSNPKHVAPKDTYTNFTISNHIDYETDRELIELKATKDSPEFTYNKYISQLGFHHIVLVEHCQLDKKLVFWHYDTADIYQTPDLYEYDSEKLTSKLVDYSDISHYVENINEGLSSLDEMWDEIPAFEELQIVHMNETEAMQVKQLETLHNALLIAAKAKDDIEIIRKSLLVGMESKGIKSIKVDGLFSVTYKDGYKRTSIDSSKVKKKLGQDYSDYIKLSDVKPTIQVKLIS